ncbi:flavin-containing monooxygenase [Micromonospora krabiensis]|uniref:Predicted flavoprotein CzcO associated with the cation diffusion facilitator CzcD n=1 Tax=Micromonospora krabiensis TaxID=307121 RepID=A0A1C3MYB3_9ACTN|nr:NAD(P)/FAD-dependent oxidoreductase [Micromonospora krabiensis]SBV25323.1 Predicted flavoprotein CzcO associated with the cation diffusion facilitator CzcD [Micromonospora krabiensis]
MRIAVVGAGFGGLSAAKVLRQSGFDVTVYEKATDVGGVWSRSRRYPGLQTQNDKGTYRLSDLRMPRHYPQWLTGEQVQRYLESYVELFGLGPTLRLATEVVSAELVDGGTGWRIGSRPAGSDEPPTWERYDHLTVANGIFSDPNIPAFPGRDEFVAAGGRVLATGDLHDLATVRDRHVVVVGHGKSSCDVAVPVSDVAARTHLVARELLWKMPRKLGPVNYKYLLLTRMGEALFRYVTLRGVERFLHGPGDRVRQAMLRSVGAAATRQLKLRELGLVPHGTFSDIARSTVSLATEGFSDRVAEGRITVHRDTVVEELLLDGGRPAARLRDGTVLPADLVICGTGFRQHVPFLDPALHARLQDGSGNFLLHRQILPIDVPHLTFAGYNSSFFSPLSAEMAAVWIAAYLRGGVDLPPAAQMREQVGARLAWMQERTAGHHARGTNIIPFSMHNIDEVLDELGLNVGPLTRARQWLLPVDPAAYRRVTPRMIRRTAASAAGRGAAATTVPADDAPAGRSS